MLGQCWDNVGTLMACMQCTQKGRNIPHTMRDKGTKNHRETDMSVCQFLCKLLITSRLYQTDILTCQFD